MANLMVLSFAGNLNYECDIMCLRKEKRGY